MNVIIDNSSIGIGKCMVLMMTMTLIHVGLKNTCLHCYWSRRSDLGAAVTKGATGFAIGAGLATWALQ